MQSGQAARHARMGAPAAQARISRRIGGIAESATLAVDAKAKALKAAGRPVIGFGAGEPDFPTPDYIVEAAVEAARDPTQPPLHPRRRPARAQGTRSRPRPRATPATQVDAVPGARHERRQTGGLRGIRHPARPRRRGAAPRAVLDDLPRGDPARRRRAGRGAGRRVSGLPRRPSSSSRPRAPTAPRRCCSARRRTRPAPSTRREQVRAIGEWALEHGVWVVTDEIYEHLVYGDAEFSSIVVEVPDLADTCVVLNGVAKTYAMTGWRVGWMIGPRDVVKAATNLQSHATSNVANVSQRAALAAVSGDLSAVATMREAFDRRRHTMVSMLNDVPGFVCPEPMGAFYAYPAVKGALGRDVERARRRVVGRSRRDHPRRGRGRGRPGRGVRHARLPAAVVRARRRRSRRGCRPDPVAAGLTPRAG